MKFYTVFMTWNRKEFPKQDIKCTNHKGVDNKVDSIKIKNAYKNTSLRECKENH